MELNDIYIFIELYKNRSISITAEELNYTQSNISTRLQKLEQEFGMPLFNRTRSGLQSLPSTERFYNKAIDIKNSVNRLYEEFSIVNTQINIGSTQLLSRMFYPTLHIKDHHFALHTVSVNKLARNYKNRIFDIIITHTKLDDTEYKEHFYKSEQLVWASTDNYKSNSTEAILVLINRDKQCPLRHLTLEAMNSSNYKYSLIEVDTLDLMISLIYKTNCIALLPMQLVLEDKHLKTCSILPPFSLDVFIYSHLSLDKNKLCSCLINEFSFIKI